MRKQIIRKVQSTKYKVQGTIATVFFTLYIVLCTSYISFSQNNALVLNGAFVTMNGGTNITPVYLVVNQPNALGIIRTVNGGHIISESDYNFVKWNEGAATGSYVYPFGYSTTDYLPFTFNKTAGDANVAVSTYATGAPNTPLPNTVTNMNPSGPLSDLNNMAVDRFWRLQMENGVSAPSADLTFSYRGTVENTITGILCPADVVTAQYWNGGPNWVAPALNPGTACTGAVIETAQANGVSVFTTTSSQPFVLVKKTNILPVELLTFITQCDNRKVNVKWSTASELNNDFFTVERSPDALNYLPIGLVNGAGNTSTIHNYSFTDTDPLSGTSYYRLKQTDFNGTTEVFSSASLSSCGSGGLNVVIGQNPTVNGNVWVSISGAENKNVRVIVTDILGQNLYTKNFTGITGSYLLNAELQLAGGIYVVSASTSDEVFSKKIVVAR
ncbi:MAG: T9SS type A sorting domain-containing protein [Bacteroidetes bacterium]|nr:T9SS type A sorting domain-containing protein [Bacteroidota bacterium]